MEKREVSLVVGESVLPADLIILADGPYGDRHFVRDGVKYVEVTNKPLVPVRVHADRDYKMADTASFTAAVQKYGDPLKGIIFYNPKAVIMFFEESNRAEKIQLPLALSLEMKAFFGDGVGTARNQKSFLKTLETYRECVQNVEAIKPMVERLQMSKQTEFESNLDPDNFTFIYQERTGGNQTGKLPKKLIITLPYFEGSGNQVTIEADMEVEMPKTEGEKPVFKLINLAHERTERDALTLEIKSLQKQLVAWQFVYGSF